MTTEEAVIRVGQRVCVLTERGHPGEWVPLEVLGSVTAIESRPWGTDARVELDAPTVIGNIDCNEPLAWLALSAGSPKLVAVDE